MRFLFLIFLFLCYCSNSFSQIQIKPEEISGHVGERVKVCGKVFGIRYQEQAKNSPTFINVGDAYPNQLFTIVIWNNVRKQFEQAPEVLFKDKEICVTGKVVLYKEKVQIVVRRKEDLRVKEEVE